MKKIAQCAVLLAFALAFVGCDLQDEPESPTTLQDVLNNNNTVDLDEHTPSASETYTINKNMVIKGNARGANFAIADGAAVTFDGTKNIGTVTVGSSENRNAAVRAQNTNGATITLKGKDVTITNVFIYVKNCTLDSENASNSFKNVVVASTVENLTLADKTKVSALVSAADSASTITITVGESVTITEADAIVIAAVKKSNETVANKIEPILSSTLEDLKNAFEEESKKDPTGSNNFIKTKDDLTKCIKNIIQEYYDFVCEIDKKNSRAATPASSQTDITNQLKTAFDAVYKPFLIDGGEALGESFINLFTGKGATTDINLNGEINLANVTVNKGLDAFIDFANYAQEYFDDDDDDVEIPAPENRSASEQEQITRKSLFGSNYKTVNAFLTIADKYASVPKLYVLGKLNVNTKATGNADYASATAKTNIEIEVTNINNMIPELFREYSNNIEHTYVPASVNLPVTAVKPFYDIDANVALTRGQYDNFVQICKDMPEDDCDDFYNTYPPYTGSWSDYAAVNKYYDDKDKAHDAYHETARKKIKEHFAKASLESKSFSYKINYGISTTVTSSKDVPGGIITVSLSATHNDPKKVLTLMTAGVSGSDYVAVLRELEEDYGIKPTVTVTDYNGNQTFSLSGIDNIISIITDIVDNIGSIIQ